MIGEIYIREGVILVLLFARSFVEIEGHAS